VQRPRQAHRGCRAGGWSQAGTSGASVHIFHFQRNTAILCKSREPILLSKIESLKNHSIFRGDLKKLKHSHGP
jgi:hypothetical protein